MDWIDDHGELIEHQSATLAWADRLCEHAYLAGGHAAQQRPHDDPIDVVSLTRGPVADRSEAA